MYGDCVIDCVVLVVVLLCCSRVRLCVGVGLVVWYLVRFWLVGLFGLLWFVLFFMVLHAELFTMLVMIVFWVIGRLLLFLFAVFGGCLIVVLL